MISNITIILFYLLLVTLLAIGIFKLHSRNGNKILIPFDNTLFRKITMPIIELYINGVPLYFVVDSGAVYSTLNKSELEHLEYEDLKEYLNQTDKMVDSIDFKNIQIASSTDSRYIRVSFDYDIRYNCREGESKVESASFSNYTEMVLQDGQWVQEDLCADSLMYLWSW